MGAVGEVSVHGQIAKLRVPDLQGEFACEQRGLAAGIDHHPGRYFCAVVQHDARGTAVREYDIPHSRAVRHAGTGCDAVLKQDLVEPRSPDLVGMRIAPVGLAEIPAPRFGVAPPAHRRAPLPGETLPSYSVEYADVVEDRQGGGQQRFADVRARKVFALENVNRQPRSRQQRGYRAASRTPADDYRIGDTRRLHLDGAFPSISIGHWVITPVASATDSRCDGT